MQATTLRRASQAEESPQSASPTAADGSKSARAIYWNHRTVILGAITRHGRWGSLQGTARSAEMNQLHAENAPDTGTNPLAAATMGRVGTSQQPATALPEQPATIPEPLNLGESAVQEPAYQLQGASVQPTRTRAMEGL